MTNTCDMDKKVDVGKKYNKYFEVEQKVGHKRQPSVKRRTYTLNSHFIYYLRNEHPSQTSSSKPTPSSKLRVQCPWSCEKAWVSIENSLWQRVNIVDRTQVCWWYFIACRWWDDAQTRVEIQLIVMIKQALDS